MLCPISDEYILTTTATRADDGGQPEEFFVSLVQWGGAGTEIEADAYDTRVDTSFTFHPTVDGVYFFNVVGAVSGLVEEEAMVVNHNSKYLIKKEVLKIVDDIMCGCCGGDDLLVKMWGLLPTDATLANCLDYKGTLKRIDKIKNLADCNDFCSNNGIC